MNEKLKHLKIFKMQMAITEVLKEELPHPVVTPQPAHHSLHLVF